ncbi:MAG: P1 family peptidase [Deltaproteobacteria bacterium]|nr:P1 family peptidase [Deltaproteobacteria bacterium]
MTVTSLSELPGVLVGHATDLAGLTGCTAILFPDGAVAGGAVVGTATGSRELAVLEPRHHVERIHGVCLAGGSAFGLAAADGVMRVLAAHGVGHRTLAGVVPIVPAAVVYDLGLGDPGAWPDARLGEAAATQALARTPASSGCVGAGTGVSAGKLQGLACATKTGLGQAGLCTDEGLAVGALVVLNPVGDVLDGTRSGILAGARRTPTSDELLGSAALIRAGAVAQSPTHNTTLVVVATTARLTRVEAEWVAHQSAVALARRIDPPFTLYDGDVVICASVGDHAVDLHRVGLLCRDATDAAIQDACLAATPLGGLPVARGLHQPV